MEMDNISGDNIETETVDWSLSNVYAKDYEGYYLYNSTDYGVEVDRTLICKAFLGISAQVVRVCVPNGFGKTYNLNALMRFFNVINRYDMPHPDMEVNYGYNLDDETEYDVTEAYRYRKSTLVDSLLCDEAPEFFNEHYCLYPVIMVRFMHHRATTLTQFRRTLYQAVLRPAEFWIKGLNRKSFTKKQVKMFAAFEAQYEALRDITNSSTDLDADHDAMLNSLFTSLSGLLVDIHQQRCIILVDNYDYPLTSIHGIAWADQARKLYIGLLSHMLTNNSNLKKALLVGTYVLPLSAGNDGPNLDNVLTISHAAYRCNTDNLAIPSSHMSYEAALESMFGFSIQDVLGTHNAQVDMNSLVTLLLHIGYLTIGAGNTLRIPNGYLRRMWESIRLLSVFGTRDQVQQDFERHRLIEGLFDKDIALLRQEFQHALMPGLGQEALYSDQTRLELSCWRIIGKLGSPRYFPSQPTALEYSQSFLSQPQRDKCILWTVTMKPFGRYIQKLVLVFAFIHITAQDLKDSKPTPEQLASNALTTINDGGCIKQASENEVWLYLGVAYGQGKLAIDWN
ncbi:hypothetical protein H4R20_000140 [Coemansia guatemalensis]|uniref:AAA-ATPase-like domain-containing protein n=1 Tax=Coemansia guatemalensis TaxID=2761395 RepID=A0A9W8I5V4_9FUNG|nr:hypothetical protein H4R20_000140 [Coemansia guatemalensis]